MGEVNVHGRRVKVILDVYTLVVSMMNLYLRKENIINSDLTT